MTDSLGHSPCMILKGGAYIILAGGGSVVLYLGQYLWLHLQEVLTNYWEYVCGYFVTASLLSFAFCYWRGPVTDGRSLNLIKWTIQMIALVFIYHGTQIQAASVAIILIILTSNWIPKHIFHTIKNTWRRWFPEPRRLLSEQQYLDEGDEFTRQQLQELRQHCKSLNCDAWKTISRVETPQKNSQMGEW